MHAAPFPSPSSPVRSQMAWEPVQVEYLGLSLDGRDYGVDLRQVQALKRLDRAPDAQGLHDEREQQYLPVVDLHGLDGEERAARHRDGGVLVILESGQGRLALLVDRVGEVLCPEPELSPPDPQQRARGLLMRGPRGLCRVRLIDPQALLEHLGPEHGR